MQNIQEINSPIDKMEHLQFQRNIDMKKWQHINSNKLISLESAVDKLASGDKIWAGGLSSTPVHFLKELDKKLDHFEGCEIYTGLITLPYEFFKPQYKKNFKHFSLFMGAIERKLQHTGNMEIFNFHFSNFSHFFDQIKPNVVIVEVTPPDENGYLSLGACGGLANKCALKHATKVIFVINKYQPFIGNADNLVHIDQATWLVEGHHSIASPKAEDPNELELQIAQHLIPYIKDEMTVQIGIGTIPNAIGMALLEHQNLGIHTEMFTESLMRMCKAGAVNNTKKNYKPNKIVIGFATGPQELIDFLHNNPNVEMNSIDDVVHCQEVAKNDNFVSINACIMVDLIGQVASEGVGPVQISGSGGQLDFVRGANMSHGGVSILCLASTRQTKNGKESNIRTALPIGTPITTPRNDVNIIATEHGAVDLRGLNHTERVLALISIAHPEFRNKLLSEAKANGLIH